VYAGAGAGAGGGVEEDCGAPPLDCTETSGGAGAVCTAGAASARTARETVFRVWVEPAANAANTPPRAIVNATVVQVTSRRRRVAAVRVR